MKKYELKYDCDGFKGETWFGINLGMTLDEVKKLCSDEPEKTSHNPNLYIIHPKKTLEIFKDFSAEFKDGKLFRLIVLSALIPTSKKGKDLLCFSENIRKMIDASYCEEGFVVPKKQYPECFEDNCIELVQWGIELLESRFIMNIELSTYLYDDKPSEDYPDMYEGFLTIEFRKITKNEYYGDNFDFETPDTLPFGFLMGMPLSEVQKLCKNKMKLIRTENEESVYEVEPKEEFMFFQKKAQVKFNKEIGLVGLDIKSLNFEKPFKTENCKVINRYEQEFEKIYGPAFDITNCKTGEEPDTQNVKALLFSIPLDYPKEESYSIQAILYFKTLKKTDSFITLSFKLIQDFF